MLFNTIKVSLIGMFVALIISPIPLFLYGEFFWFKVAIGACLFLATVGFLVEFNLYERKPSSDRIPVTLGVIGTWMQFAAMVYLL